MAATLLTDLAAVRLAYILAGWIRVERIVERPTDTVILATIPGWLIVFFACGLYSRRQVIEPSLRIPALVSGVTASILLTIVTAFAFSVHISRGWTISVWFLAVALVFAGRLGMHWLTEWMHRASWLGLRTLIVGMNAEGRTMARVLRKKRHLGYEVMGFVNAVPGEVQGLSVLSTLDDLRQTVIDQGIGAIFVAGSGVGHETLIQIDQALAGLAVRIRTSLGLPHLAASRVVVQEVDGMAMLAVERMVPSDFEFRLKRTLDVSLAAISLVLGLPLMVAIAIAIKVTDRGPVFFAQRRVGAAGEPFTMYKFRTMVVGAERLRSELQDANEADGVLFKMRRDPRITMVGRRLRSLGLDELPQLFNILIGEMSLVGPRPALPEEMESWTSELALRLKAKPGLTGLWQVSGRHELAFEDYVRYDLFYVENWSFGLDLQIIARTIPALFARAGAY